MLHGYKRYTFTPKIVFGNRQRFRLISRCKTFLGFWCCKNFSIDAQFPMVVKSPFWLAKKERTHDFFRLFFGFAKNTSIYLNSCQCWKFNWNGNFTGKNTGILDICYKYVSVSKIIRKLALRRFAPVRGRFAAGCTWLAALAEVWGTAPNVS